MLLRLYMLPPRYPRLLTGQKSQLNINLVSNYKGKGTPPKLKEEVMSANTTTNTTVKPATLAQVKRLINSLVLPEVKVSEREEGILLAKGIFIAEVTPAMFQGEYAYITTYIDGRGILSVMRDRKDLKKSILRIFDGKLLPGLGAAVVHNEHR